MTIDSRILSTLNGVEVIVVGDVMLDRFVYGETTRISPEAPIPVLLKSHETLMLGGAANVARNVASLGGKAILLGRVGNDDDGTLIAEQLCPEAGIDARLLRTDDTTIVKTRFVSAQQQILRLDEERWFEPDADFIEALCASLDDLLPSAGALVLSDYGKGLLSQDVLDAVIARAKAQGCPIIVDPKSADLSRYRGASVLTPNAKEAQLATGLTVMDDAKATEAAQKIARSAGVGAALVTRGAEGMTLYETDREEDGPLHIPTAARSVFDVSGAGDTVVATLALAVASGHDLRDAARLSNLAAGLVVAKSGTATVTAKELANVLADETAAEVSADTIVMPETAAARTRSWQEQGLKVGFANGCFDLIHPGHVKLLERARAACDRLIVALNTDASVSRLKGESRPLQNEQSRGAVMAAIRSVDLVTFFDEDTPLELIRLIRPDVLVKGADYTVETVVGSDLVAGWGGTVALIPLEEGHSTSRIVDRAGTGIEKELGKRAG